jgi:hypothetical protein
VNVHVGDTTPYSLNFVHRASEFPVPCFACVDHGDHDQLPSHAWSAAAAASSASKVAIVESSGMRGASYTRQWGEVCVQRNKEVADGTRRATADIG